MRIKAKINNMNEWFIINTGFSGLNPFSTLIEIFLSVYNEFLLISNDLSHRC